MSMATDPTPGRADSLNWMLPYTVATATGLDVDLDRRLGILLELCSDRRPAPGRQTRPKPFVVRSCCTTT
jgi:hypothetical protein